MKTDSVFSKEQIATRFYSNVRSETELEEFSYDEALMRESFYFGDMDDEGNFVIKHHSPQEKGSKPDPDTFCILGKITDREGGSTIEYTVERIQFRFEMWIAWIAVCAILFLLTVFREPLAGIVLLVIMSSAIALGILNPFEKKKIVKLLKNIITD